MTYKNPCPGQEEKIYRWFDNDLSAIEKKAFETHLSTCESCQKLVVEIETLFADVSAMGMLSAPPEIIAGVMRSLPTKAASSPAKSDASAWIFIIQGIFGVILLAMTLPQMLLSISLPFNMPQWQLLMAQMQLPAGWLSAWAQGLWTQLADVAFLTLSPILTMGIIVALGVAWLFSSRVLLKPSHHHSMKNGGSI